MASAAVVSFCSDHLNGFSGIHAVSTGTRNQADRERIMAKDSGR
jgi:hypothetical protein